MRPDRREERTRQDELVQKDERSTQGELVQKDERSTQDEPMPQDGPSGQDELVQRALRSAAYDEVGERMRRQLVESMLFERLVPFEELEAAGHAEGDGAAGRGRLRFALRAADRDGAPSAMKQRGGGRRRSAASGWTGRYAADRPAARRRERRSA